MKIITRVVINMNTGKVLEEESFEYTGPLALCDGGGGDGGGDGAGAGDVGGSDGMGSDSASATGDTGTGGVGAGEDDSGGVAGVGISGGPGPSGFDPGSFAPTPGITDSLSSFAQSVNAAFTTNTSIPGLDTAVDTMGMAMGVFGGLPGMAMAAGLSAIANAAAGHYGGLAEAGEPDQGGEGGFGVSADAVSAADADAAGFSSDGDGGYRNTALVTRRNSTTAPTPAPATVTIPTPVATPYTFPASTPFEPIYPDTISRDDIKPFTGRSELTLDQVDAENIRRRERAAAFADARAEEERSKLELLASRDVNAGGRLYNEPSASAKLFGDSPTRGRARSLFA
uniref:Uncharacterized protein n=1 Tax=viral metagenome TaxID=1070528 RepID=A0A6M3L8B3_9ZZZZ